MIFKLLRVWDCDKQTMRYYVNGRRAKPIVYWRITNESPRLFYKGTVVDGRKTRTYSTAHSDSAV